MSMASPIYHRFRNAKTIVFWLFLMIPIVYLLLAVWVLLELPFPKQWGIHWEGEFSNATKEYYWPGVATFFTFDNYKNDLVYPLDGSFRNLMASCIFIGFTAGLAIGQMQTSLSRSLQTLATLLVVFASGAFLAWELGSDIVGCGFSACYIPSDFIRGLGVHNLAHGTRSFLTAIEVIGIIATFTCMSVWSGAGTAKIIRAIRQPDKPR